MKLLLLVLITLSSLVYAEEELDQNEQFAEDYIQQFDLFMSLTDVRTILLKKRDKLEFFNNCTEQFEYPVTDCDKGFRLVTTIRLPDEETNGIGDLQLYFAFNKEQQLINTFYEIYYTEDFT